MGNNSPEVEFIIKVSNIVRGQGFGLVLSNYCLGRLFDELSDRLVSQEDNYAALLREVERLKERVETDRRKKALLHDENAALQAEADRRTRELEFCKCGTALTVECPACDAGKAEANCQMEKERDEPKRRLWEKLKNEKVLHENQRIANARLTARVEELEKERDNWRQQHVITAQERDEWAESVSVHQGVLAESAKRCAELQAEVEMLKGDYAELEKERDEMAEMARKYIQQCGKLRAEVERLKGDYAELEMIEHERDIGQKDADLNHRDELAALRTEVERLTNTIPQLEVGQRGILALTDENAALRKEVDRLKDEYVAVWGRNEKLEQEVDRLKAEFKPNALDCAMADLRKEVERLRLANTEMARLLVDLTTNEEEDEYGTYL